MVDIRSVVPDISVDMRYAGVDNFTGTVVDGYLAPRCYLRAEAAAALARVELALRMEGLRLHLFDCYRPVRAVRHFLRWAGDASDQRTKWRFYPNLPKGALLDGYIAPVSGHSGGSTVDLTLLDCTPEADRCTPLDMGTEFDFFDSRANTESPQISAVQKQNRQRLLRAMAAQGFDNYPLEWWHFRHAGGQSRHLYDIPIE